MSAHVIARWSIARRWLHALKPLSWPKLLVPTLLGQAVGAAAVGQVDGAALVIGLAFTALDVTFVVLLNDWGDQRVDAIKRQRFPDGCSPKTIPDGILPAAHLLVGGLATGALAVALCLVVAGPLGRPALRWAGPACLGVFWLYSLPPIRLNYRGGGELLEMLGVGLALPLLNAYLQAGRIPTGLLLLVPGLLALAASSAIASGLSDEESDREGGKRTVVTTLGNRRARATVEGLVVAGLIGWGLASTAPVLGALTTPTPGLPWWAPLPAVALGLARFPGLRRLSNAATTNAFRAQASYKQALHRIMWDGSVVLAAVVLLAAATGR